MQSTLAGYLWRRVLITGFGLWLVSLLSFAWTALAPGSAVDALLGEAGIAGGDAAVRLEREFGLDAGWVVQYGRWLGGLLGGDWGYSHVLEQDLGPYLFQGLALSARLGLLALLWMALLGLGSGIWTAFQRGGVVDGVLRVLGLLGLSLPSFWLGLLGLLGALRWLGVLPIYNGQAGSVWQEIWVWGLPSLVAGLRGAGLLQRFTRAAMLETLRQDYWRTALAKGVHPMRAVVVHGLRNVLPPLVTLLGLEAAFMLGGLVVTETVFNIPGLGFSLVQAVRWRDWPTVRAMLFLFALLTFAINLLVDFLNALLDVRQQQWD